MKLQTIKVSEIARISVIIVLILNFFHLYKKCLIKLIKQKNKIIRKKILKEEILDYIENISKNV